MMEKSRDAKPHIGIFGRRNNGKSSLINSLTGQDIAIVSDIPGTTTDPVKKSIEIPGIGPAVLIDTAGLDDSGELGNKRVDKTRDTLKKIDLAIIVLADSTFGETEEQLIKELDYWEVPYILIHNKADIQTAGAKLISRLPSDHLDKFIEYSSLDISYNETLVKLLEANIPESAYLNKTLVGDIIKKGDLVLLIAPIDAEAPEGRLILPQVQLARDILDNEAVAVVTTETELENLLKNLQPKPALAICDSQVFRLADKLVPKDIPLTSFSTVLARYKGDFENYKRGTPKLSELKDGDKVLVLESCTHHVACDDIGREKIPAWLKESSGKKLDFTVVSGLNNIPGNISDYSILIQCGGCMITRKQLINRLKPAIDAGIPVTNYGMAIAYMHGIYERALAPFNNVKI